MVLNQLKTSLIILDLESKIIYLNNSAENLFLVNFQYLSSKESRLESLGVPALNRLFEEFKIHGKANRDIKIFNNYLSVSVKQILDFIVFEIYPPSSHSIDQSTHELKRPIQNIKSLVEALSVGAKNDSQKSDEYLLKISQEAERLASMVNDMLSLAKLNQAELEKIPLNLFDFIESILQNFHTQKNICFVNNISANIIIQADKNLFEHLLLNIIDNAVKYNQDRGQVIVDFANNIISIQDTGFGMDQDECDKIFEQFYRAKSVLAIPGTGLGLNIVKAIADLHGWQIRVYSQKNIGSKFEIILS